MKLAMSLAIMLVALTLTPAAAQPSPGAPASSPAALTPTRLDVEGAVQGPCVGKGGCRYYLTLVGPGLPGVVATVELIDDGSGVLLPMPGLPETLAPGRYGVEASSWAVSDAIVDGQAALVQRDASCWGTLEVRSEPAARIRPIYDTETCEITFALAID